MQLVDARRLTGPNLLSRSPQVLVELAFDVADDLQAALATYSTELGRMRKALDLPDCPALNVRAHLGGAVIGYDAAIDVMLACAEMSEWAALSACELAAGRIALPLEPKRLEIAQQLDRDRSPRLLALDAEAARRGIPLFWDDEEVSVGAGSRSACWPRGALPIAADVHWHSLGTVPISLVTGTNGKTTCTRLLARIAREAGMHVGSTSSDEIAVGGAVIDTGDWTGPAAARTVLRRKDIDFAVLETARGGILRRGLAIAECDAALITNVSDDHLGGYGIDDLEAMMRVKAVAAEAVRPSGTVVLNAHDPKLVALAEGLGPRVVFFADLSREDPEARAVIARHRASGGTASSPRADGSWWLRATPAAASRSSVLCRSPSEVPPATTSRTSPRPWPWLGRSGSATKPSSEVSLPSTLRTTRVAASCWSAGACVSCSTSGTIRTAFER